METDSAADLLKYAHQRLHPSLQDPNYLVLRARRDIFRKWIEALDREHLSVLDVGGRYQPYRPLFVNANLQYVACDLQRTALVDVVANAEELPFASGMFDVVLSTQVFEYVTRPAKGAEEIYRVLKPGGVLLMSVCAMAPRFGDDECWRYTPRGIHAVLTPFAEVTIVPESSGLGGLMRTANLGLHTYAHFHAIRKCVQWTLCPLLNAVGLAMERLRLSKNDQFTPNYSIRAVK